MHDEVEQYDLQKNCSLASPFGAPKIAEGQRPFLSGMKIFLRLLVVGILPAPLGRSIPRSQDFSGES